MTVPVLDTFPVHRLNVRVPDFSDFRHRYEQAVPLLPSAEIDAMVERGAPWAEMLDYIDAVAPNGFLIYWHSDIHQVMHLAGDDTRCFAYLMGNHTIAERMFRHDPRTMLYAPLRTTIWEHTDGTAWFSTDQPSSHFSSLAIPEITQVGVELDRKLANLLEALDVEVPARIR
jgi:uncharacterized protein (DUF302 family)